MRLLGQVRETISRYSMFPLGARIGVAVSGGPDSVALLTVLRELALDWELSLVVLHLNHCLRGPESDEDEQFVRVIAGELPCIAERRAVGQECGNLEQNARSARLGFFRRMMVQHRLAAVATGHTRSDQAETVLFRLIRGAGTAGLAGILPVTSDKLVRPLIHVSRPEVKEFLEAREIPWRQDTSNCDLRFTRNRIRHELLPVIESGFNPRIDEVLASAAEVAREEERYWDGIAEAALWSCARPHPRGAIIDCEAFGELHPATARRVIRKAIAAARGDLRRIEFAHVEALREVLSGGPPAASVPGAVAVRSGGAVLVGRAPDRTPVTLSIPSSTAVANWGTRLVLRESGYNTDDRLMSRGGPLVLRTWRPGDEYQPAGSRKPRKLKDLFQQARIPLWIVPVGRLLRRTASSSGHGSLVRLKHRTARWCST